jgi:hypothetical protein
MKYVSVYQRSGRGVWHIAYPDAVTGKRICCSTVHRIEDPTSKQKAYTEVMQLAKKASAAMDGGKGTRWDQWVPQWMEVSYTGKTLQRYRDSSWKALRFYLHERQLPTPRAIRYEHGQDYLTFRTSQKRHRGTFYNYNTALCELRFLGSVMRESVRRGYCEANPLAQLGLSKRAQKEKPEITVEEDAKIRLELLTRPVWMRECYQIAICQGCRLMETQVPLAEVDLARNAVTFRGKGNKIFTTSIHPSVRPLAEAKKKEGASHLTKLPPMPAKHWWIFFREVGLPHLCFHCTKVTVITRLCRAGVPQGVAMSYVNHSKEEVHRVYQRLKLADVSMATAALASTPLMLANLDAIAPTTPLVPVSCKVRKKASPVLS